MSIDDKVMRHYGRDRLEEQIVEAVRAAGKDPDRLIASDLSPVDEFHLGWHEQTLAFAKELSFGPGMLILDVGCGIGGPARSFAEFSGCRVAGIDLTPDFITVADALTRRCRLDDRVSFRQASALDLPFDDATFDGAIQFHVGMNISDKAAAFAEVRRVLKPGAAFGLYDIVATGSGELPFPLPWAVSAETSFVEPLDTYRRLLAAAGFRIDAERNRRDFCLALGRERRAEIETHGLPRLGLHVIIGPAGPEQIANVSRALAEGLIAPVEIIARVPG